MIVQPITGAFGARIWDIDLSKPLDGNTVQEIKHLIAQKKVLAFPDQTQVDAPGLLSFAKNFGIPEEEKVPNSNFDSKNTILNDNDIPAIKTLHMDGTVLNFNRGDNWHTDGATRPKTSWLSFLQAVDVPPYGRDTAYSDMEAAYDSLSASLKTFLNDMTALHSWGYQKPDAPPVEHPIVVVNPYTGRKAVYVNRGYTRSIVNVSADESDWILEYLFKLPHKLEHQLRISWTPGTIVVWDNERTQHYVVLDRQYPRVMRRVMVLQ